MNDILLACLILFSGFVPVTIALWYSRRLLDKAQLLQEMAQDMYKMGKAERENTVKEMKAWLLGEEYGIHFKNVINGIMGKNTQMAKQHMNVAAGKLGIPPLGAKAIADGAASFAEDYGVSPKTAKGLKETIKWFLTRPSKEQKDQQDQMIKQMAAQYGYSPEDPLQPVIEQQY